MTPNSILILAALAAFTPALSHAADPKETAPAKAPAPLATLPKEGLPTVWLQGEPVKEFEPGTLYVFEFWATWCGPCLQAMPHMESLYQKFKDNPRVRIVGVNVMDRVPTEKLLPFLKGKGLTINYTMAADGPAGTVQKSWLTPLGVTGIPHAVAVRDGRIVWRGHPGSLEAGLLEAMTKADYSPEKAPPTKESLRAAFAPKINAAATAAAKGELADAIARLRTVAAECPEESVVLSGVESAFSACVRRERAEDALALAKLIAEFYPKSRTALLNAGHLVLDTEGLEKKDPAFARECAERALALNAEDIAGMELKAAALFASGERETAVALQETALKSTKLHREIEALRAEIAEAGKPASAQ